ncbi:MAG: hypothetical protein LBL03_01320 [Endomicrobium sp.]|jgi:acetyl-CoA carboxylase biotin carboxyl carrier protein|nr:hypothetical protein [Endomicrobium sp.]
MNSQEMKKFLKLLRNTDIEELKYQKGNDFFHIKRDCAVYDDEKSIKEKINIKKENNIDAKKEDCINTKKENNTDIEKQKKIEIKSQTVGTFISLKNIDSTNSLYEGKYITSGQKIGQIEAMKIIKDISCNKNGKIVKIFVSDKDPIEYGQKLFLIEEEDKQ